MALQWDPWGNAYDDGTGGGEWDDQYEFTTGAPNNNMYLGGEMFGGGMPMFAQDVTKQGELAPYGIQTQARQANFGQDVLSMIADPTLGMLASLISGQPGVDYSSFTGGGVGQGGGYGGGGYGGGARPSIFTTDFYESTQTPGADPLVKNYADRIFNGRENPATLKLEVIKDGLATGLSEEETDVYLGAIDTLAQEYSGLNKTNLENAQLAGQRQLSPVEEKWAKMGLPSPLEEYTPETLPAGLMPDLDPAMARYYKRFTDLDARAKEAAKGARYGPFPPLRRPPPRRCRQRSVAFRSCVKPPTSSRFATPNGKTRSLNCASGVRARPSG